MVVSGWRINQKVTRPPEAMPTNDQTVIAKPTN